MPRCARTRRLNGGMMASAHELAAPSHQRLADWLEQPGLQRILIALILINAVVLGLETSRSIAWPHGAVADRDRPHDSRHLRCRDRPAPGGPSPCVLQGSLGVFDFIVVAIALIPASGPLAVLRALRVLRVLRLITLVPSMKRVVGGLLAALPGPRLGRGDHRLIFYVAAVIATKLFAADYPQWFGSLGASAFTLFR